MVTKWNKSFTIHRTGCDKCSGTGWKLLSNQEPVWCDCRPKKLRFKDEQTKESGYYCYLNLYTKSQIDNLII